jgi:hypothetical protein
MLLWSDWRVLLLNGSGTRVNASRTSFTNWSDKPDEHRPRNGTVGDESKAASRRSLAALLFAQSANANANAAPSGVRSPDHRQLAEGSAGV